MKKLRSLHRAIKENSQSKYRPVVNIDGDCIYLMDNCGNKIYYDEFIFLVERKPLNLQFRWMNFNYIIY